MCVWRHDTLKTNNPTLRKLFLKYTQTDPTDKLTLQQKEIWPRSMSNNRKKMNTECSQNVPGYPQKKEEGMWKEYTWVCSCKTGRHVESLDLNLGKLQIL
jgi:hypothetical protein